MEHELGKHADGKALPHKFIDIAPDELHEQDEQADEEGTRKQQEKLPENEYVEFL